MKHSRWTQFVFCVTRSLLILIITLPSNICHGQWRLIASLGEPVQSIYFLGQLNAPNLGFVGTTAGVWRTSNSGNTWTKVSQIGQASDFAFQDTLTGWCSSRSGPGCYRTADGGMTWNPLSINATGEAVHYVSLSHLLFLSSWSRGEFSSSDAGMSWQNWNPNHLNGFSFGSDSLGIVGSSPQLSTPILWTRDGGITWRASNLIQEVWQVLMVNGTSVCFAIGERGGGLNRSVDGGMSWEPITFSGLSGEFLTGCVRGNLCDLYLQASDGVYCSRSQGRSWEFIGGPNNVKDTRFYASGYSIYAGDTLGNVWSYLDTANRYNDVTLNMDTNFVNFGTVGNCQSMDYVVHFSNYLYCDSITIASIVWDTSDPTIQLENLPKHSQVLLPEQQDSLVFRYSPTAGGKTSSASLRLKIVLGGVEHDTVISLTGSSFATPRATLSANSLNFDTLSTCDTSIRSFTITNPSCDSIKVRLTANPSSGFAFLTPWKDYSIAGGESDTFRIALHSSISTTAFSFLQLQFQPSIGASYGNTVNLTGTVIAGTSNISIPNDTLNFGNISTCSNRTLPAYFISSGCDSLSVSGESIGGLDGFSVLNTHTGLLAVGSEDSVLLHFAPPGVGMFSDTLRLSTSAGVKTISVQGNGVPDSGKVTLSTASLKFDTVTASCDSSTASFSFTNTTCTAITVDSVGGITPASEFQSSGAGTSGRALLKDSALTVALKFVPGTAGQFTGNAVLYYHGPDNIEHDTTITLAGTATASPTIGVTMKPASYSTSALGTVDIPFYLTGNLDAKSSQTIGLQTLTLDLAMNTDLLTPLSANPVIANIPQIPVQITKNVVTLSVTLPANLTFTDSTLLMTLHCQAFVTDTMQTAITLTSATFTSQNATACFAQSASITSSTFALVASCEDSVLTGDLAHGVAFTIESIVPNPTNGKVTVMLLRSTDHAIRYELCDVLGDVVASGLLGQGQPPPLLASANPRFATANQRLQKAGEYYLNFGAVPSGSYYLRLSTQSQVESRRIILAR